jgi:hypothetical protein
MFLLLFKWFSFLVVESQTYFFNLNFRIHLVLNNDPDPRFVVFPGRVQNISGQGIIFAAQAGPYDCGKSIHHSFLRDSRVDHNRENT